MELKDFIYNYGLYNRTNVSAVLLIENWNDSDYDDKYADYLKEYINLKNLFVDTNEHPDTTASFEFLKKKRVKEVYANLFDLMISRIKSIKGDLSPGKIETFKARLGKFYLAPEKIDFDYIKCLRQIEEEEY
jgi:hypothetical protein